MFYKEIDLPPIPEDFITENNFKLHKEVKDIGYNGEFYYQNKKLIACNYKVFEIITEGFKDWAVSNIDGVIKTRQFLMQTQEPVPGTIGTHIVHSDLKRYFALNYMMDTGGSNVTTNWYLEKGKPLYRTKLKGGSLSDDGDVNYNNLELLESVVLQPKKWYILDVRPLHDVQNITGIRRSVSLGFSSVILKHTTLV